MWMGSLALSLSCSLSLSLSLSLSVSLSLSFSLQMRLHGSLILKRFQNEGKPGRNRVPSRVNTHCKTPDEAWCSACLLKFRGRTCLRYVKTASCSSSLNLCLKCLQDTVCKSQTRRTNSQRRLPDCSNVSKLSACWYFTTGVSEQMQRRLRSLHFTLRTLHAGSWHKKCVRRHLARLHIGFNLALGRLACLARLARLARLALNFLSDQKEQSPNDNPTGVLHQRDPY